jgi:hypothetical protein
MDLGLHIDETLSWKLHIDELVPKMNSACYAVRTVKGFMSQETLKMIYCAYVHSIIEYGIILGGNTSNSITVFRIQKRIIRVIMNARTRDSCRDLFVLYCIVFYSSSRDPEKDIEHVIK